MSGVLVDSSDSLFVFDYRQGRMTVFSSDYRVVRAVNLSVPIVGEGLFVGTTMVINQGLRSPGLFSWRSFDGLPEWDLCMH